MEAVYFDGLRPQRRIVTLALRDGQVVGEGDAEFQWPLSGIRLIDHHDDRLRLGPPDGGVQRLLVGAGDWEQLTGHAKEGLAKGLAGREWRLVAGLAAAGAGILLVLVFGIPAAARPLALATPPSLEMKIGRNLEAETLTAFPPCKENPAAAERLDALGEKLASGTRLPFPIRVRPVHATIVNAFALPGGTILVTDKLIAQAKTSDELAGVLAHEIAHIERRHVMQSVWESMGLGVVMDVVAGGGSGATQQAVVFLGSATQQRFSRSLESEADARGIELLRAQNISSAGMADFFERMEDEHSGAAARTVEEWFDSHPDSARRAAVARRAARPGAPALSPDDWRQVKQVCAAQMASR